MKEITREDWQKNPTPRMMWVWDEFECQKEQRLVVHCFASKEATYLTMIMSKAKQTTLVMKTFLSAVMAESGTNL